MSAQKETIAEYAAKRAVYIVVPVVAAVGLYVAYDWYTETIFEKAGAGIKKFTDRLKLGWSNIKDGVGNTFEKIGDGTEDVFGFLFLKEKKDERREVVVKVGDTIKDKVSDIGDGLKDVGENVGDFFKGIFD